MKLNGQAAQHEHWVPEQLRNIIKRIRRSAFCWHVGLWDSWHVRRMGCGPLPPANLRFRVHGHPYIEGFLRVGAQCRKDIELGLQKINTDLTAFLDVLDFGCGCGRTLIAFADHPPSMNFYGSDIDREAIAWCRNHLSCASFELNDALPPLSYPAGQFDLIYAISVFTHLREDLQFQWLDELKRIAKPGAILLISVQGGHYWDKLSAQHLAQLQRTGFLFVEVSSLWRGLFPDWYRTTFHTKEYVVEKWSKNFKVLAYVPKGINKVQDLVILQRP